MFTGYRSIIMSSLSLLVGAGIMTQAQLEMSHEFLGAVIIVLNGLAIFYKFLSNKREELLKNTITQLR